MNLKKTTCRALIVSMFAFSFQAAGAGMIGAEQAQTSRSERTFVLDTLSRADTSSQLQALGVDPQQARERIGAMSDAEVAQLAADMRTAPAGADGGTVLAVIVIAAAIWYFAFRR